MSKILVVDDEKDIVDLVGLHLQREGHEVIAVGNGLAVLPAATSVLPVGGITPDNMGHWQAAGARGFGIGSALYKPGKAAAEVARSARDFVAACRRPGRA